MVETLDVSHGRSVAVTPSTWMRAKREHRMPLCRRAVEILDAARMLDEGASPLVFTSGIGKPLGNERLRQLLQ